MRHTLAAALLLLPLLASAAELKHLPPALAGPREELNHHAVAYLRHVQAYARKLDLRRVAIPALPKDPRDSDRAAVTDAAAFNDMLDRIREAFGGTMLTGTHPDPVAQAWAIEQALMRDGFLATYARHRPLPQAHE
jgi:hypothetical protein